MKRLEDLIRSLRKWYYGRQGFIYDHSKRMWYKTRSTCHNAPVIGKTLFKDKPLTKPFSEYNDKQKPLIKYRDFCTECGNKCNTITKVRS